jgi:glycosyltransferase involved in cell wall biosynthesis
MRRRNEVQLMNLPPLNLPAPENGRLSNAGLPPCLSVIMPVYNEGATVACTVSRVLAQPPVVEVIAVDDGSRDDTSQILADLSSSQPRLRLSRHERNRGKGAAVRTGIGMATAPIVIIQDADAEYDPAEYHTLVHPILANQAEVVYGSRFLGARAHRVLYFWHSLGNQCLTLLSNMATDLNLTDMETCYKAFRREVIQSLPLREDRFGFEPEITAKISRLKIRIYEVPISYHGRTYAEGKKANWRDGLSALRCIVKYGLLGF